RAQLVQSAERAKGRHRNRPLRLAAGRVRVRPGADAPLSSNGRAVGERGRITSSPSIRVPQRACARHVEVTELTQASPTLRAVDFDRRAGLSSATASAMNTTRAAAGSLILRYIDRESCNAARAGSRFLNAASRGYCSRNR